MGVENSGTAVAPSLDVSARAGNGITIAELAGELDIATAPALREQLLGLLRPGSSRLIVDLSKVTYCDSSGLAVLVGAGRHARLLGGFLHLAAASSQTLRVLQLTGLGQHLPLFPTVGAAAAILPAARPRGLA
jgi:anti-sigma B factor antagonist